MRREAHEARARRRGELGAHAQRRRHTHTSVKWSETTAKKKTFPNTHSSCKPRRARALVCRHGVATHTRPHANMPSQNRPPAPRDAAARAASLALRRPASPTSRAAVDGAWRDGWLLEINALRGRCEGGGGEADAAEVRECWVLRLAVRGRGHTRRLLSRQTSGRVHARVRV